MTKQQPRRPPR